MKRLISILLLSLSITLGYSQKVIKVGCGEYGNYILRQSDSLPYLYVFSNVTHVISLTPVSVSAGTHFFDISGGLYSGMALANQTGLQGTMYELAQGSATPIYIPTDTLGNPYTNNISCVAYFFTYITAKSDGTGWITGNDVWNMTSNGSAVYSKPTKLKNPTSGTVRYVKFAAGAVLLGLTNDGKVYKFNGNSGVPTLVNLPKPATDIAAGRQGQCYAIVPVDTTVTKAYGTLYGWGDGGANPGSFMGNISGSPSSPTNMSSTFSTQLTYPIQKFATNENNSQFIDTAGRMWAIGNNSPPGMGNNFELVNHAEIYNNPATGSLPYVWDWAFQPGPTTRFLTAPVQVGASTKWKNVWSGNSYCFYFYATDTRDSVYSWGREKSFVLGNGQTTTGASEANFPNFMDVLVPTIIHPFITPITGITGGQDVVLYTCNAGRDQVVNLPTSSVSLVGSASASSSYTISSYRWAKLTGPACTITSPASTSTTVTGLTQGTYTFQLLTTDNNTATIADTVQVTVNASTGNIPPTVTATASQTNITLPASSVILSGTATASGNQGATITSTSWTQISGPIQTNISDASSISPTVTGMTTAGSYVFQITATDNNLQSSSATVTIIVNPVPSDCHCLSFPFKN